VAGARVPVLARQQLAQQIQVAAVAVRETPEQATPLALAVREL
jgi:hypothetical protein